MRKALFVAGLLPLLYLACGSGSTAQTPQNALQRKVICSGDFYAPAWPRIRGYGSAKINLEPKDAAITVGSEFSGSAAGANVTPTIVNGAGVPDGSGIVKIAMSNTAEVLLDVSELPARIKWSLAVFGVRDAVAVCR